VLEQHSLRLIFEYIYKTHPSLVNEVIPSGKNPELHEQTSIRFSGDPSASDLSRRVSDAFFRTLALEHKLPDSVLKMIGQSGRKYRIFINNLIGSFGDARYLEIGSYTGSTACAAIYGNTLQIVCIDNWSGSDDRITPGSGGREKFHENIGKTLTKKCELALIEKDFREIDYSELVFAANIYFFDGPHEEKDQYDGVKLVYPVLDQEFILIVDDFNWLPVRSGTFAAIKDLGLHVNHSIEILTTTNGSHPVLEMESSDWHNGYYIAAVKK
jgi:hypothetical protein